MNDIDWLAEELKKQQTVTPIGQASANTEVAIDIKPDREAEIDRLSADLNMQREQVRQDQENLNAINERDKAIANAQDTPVTKDILDNPLTEGAAQDDTGILGDLERIFVNAPKAGWDRGQAMVELSDLGYASYQSGEIGDEYLAKVAELEARMQVDTGVEGFFQEIPALMGEQLPIMGSLLWGAKEEAAAGLATGALLRNPIKGLGTGAKYGMGLETAKMEAGFAFNDIIRMTDENGERMPIEAARSAALMVGIANGALEMVSFGPMMRAVPGGDRLLKAMSNGKTLRHMMKRPKFREAMMSFGKRLGYGAFTEGWTEGLQEVTQLMGQEVAAALADGEFETPSAGDYGASFGEGAKMGAQAALGFMVSGASIATGFDWRAKKIADDRRTAFEALAEKATDSKLRERLPERFKDFVSAVQEKHGTVSEVYVDVEAAETFFQEFTDAELQQHMPEAYESLKEARAAGGDVVIPVGEFATYVAPSEQFSQMADDMKFDPDDLTPRQLQDIDGTVEAAKKAMIESFGEPDSMGAIFEDFKAKLEGAGYTGDSSALQAQLMQSVITSLAESSGMDTQAFYDQFKIDITTQLTEDTALTGMEQDATRLQRAQEMEFNTEQTWYHGTDKTFSSFDGMTFLTEHTDEASAYANTPAYARQRYTERWRENNVEGRATKSDFGRIRSVGVVDDITEDGLWATDDGVVRKEGKKITYLSNAVAVDDSFDISSMTIEIVEGESDAYQEAMDFMDAGPSDEVSSPQIIPAYIRNGKFKEVEPRVANLLGARLNGNLPPSLQKKYERLLEDIEGWKEEGYVGISTTSDDLGFTMSGESAPAQRIVFDSSNIRSVNAQFEQEGENILYQTAEEVSEYAYATAQKMVEMPPISLQSLVGRTVQFTFADLTAAGSVYSGMQGLDVDGIPLLGGPGFPMQEVYNDAGVGWVFRNKGKVTGALNKMNNRGADVMIVLAMEQNAHRSNSTVAKTMVYTFDAAFQAGKITSKDLAFITNEIKNVAAFDRLTGFPGFGDTKAAHQWLDELTFDERAAVAKVLESKRVQNIDGVPNISRLLNEVRDKGANGVQIGDALMAIQLENARVDFKEKGIPLHPDYEMGIHGSPIGRFIQPISWDIIIKDELAKMGKPLSFMNVDRVPLAITITQEMADKAAKIEALPTPTTAFATLVSAMNNDWRSTQQAVKAGGLSPKRLEDDLKASPASAVLSEYTAKEIAAGAKDGSLVFHRLGESKAYVGVKSSGNIETYTDYGATKEQIAEWGMSNDSVTMVGVFNDTPGAKGLVAAQVAKGIEEGVEFLDCFSVPSVKYPRGFLNTVYEEFGFEKVGDIPFNRKHLSDEMVALWEAGGWSEKEHGLPPIAIMKWKGDDNARSDTLSNLIAEDGAGGTRGDIDPRAEATVEENFNSDSQDQDGGGDNGARAAGDDRTRSGYFTSKLVQGIKDINTLDKSTLAAYGVTNETLTQIDEKHGTTLFQEARQPKGYIQFNDARDYFKITMTGKADLSTFLHESGHMFLEMMEVAASSPNATDQVKRDLARIRDWIGAAPGEKLTRDHHEKFARGFEAYLMEGKSPNANLVEAFNRFRSWMVNIYKDIQALLAIEGIELNDDVREVFDRLVGADEAFQKQLDDYAPLFKDAAEAGMTEAQYATYIDVHQKAIQSAKDQLDREAVEDARRQHRTNYLKRKEQLIEEVTKAIEAQPVQSVIDYLTAKDRSAWTNVPEEYHPYKLDSNLVKDLLGSIPPKLRRFMQPDSALSADELAPLFGFETGLQMLTAMEEQPPKQATIESEVRAALQAEFGDYRFDGKLDDVAIEKLHSNKIGQHLMAEVRAISRRVGAPFNTSQMAIARLAAREHISKIPVLKLRPAKYLSAEKKAARLAADALAAGDYNEALRQKLMQLSNHQMYRAANDAKLKSEKIRERLVEVSKMLGKKGNYIGMAGDHFRDAIIALLQGVELRKVSGHQIDRRASLQEYLKKMESEGDDVMLPPEHLNALSMTNYKQMSLAELQTLRDSIDRIAKTAKLKNTLQVGKQKRDLRKFVTESKEAMEENAPKVKKRPKYKETLKSKSVDKLLSWQAALTKIEFLCEWIDGKTGGNFHRMFFQPFVDAQEREFDIMVDLTARIQKQLKRAGNLKRDVKFLGEDMTMETIYAIALNMGNEGNLKKLLEGKGWSKEQVVSEIQKHMTATDFEIVQELWDIVNSLWPEMQDVYMRAHGIRPPKVEASELHLEELGITLRGGYYPIVYDPREKTKFNNKAGVEGRFENNLFKANVSAGFMETRTEFVDPLKLDLSPLGSHLNETVHFLTHYEAVRNADKILRDSEFALAFQEHFGYEHYEVVGYWLDNVANNGVPKNAGVLDDLAKRARIGTSITAMGLNIGSGLIQPLGLLTTMDAHAGGRRIGMTPVLKHIVTSAFNPVAWKFVEENSGEIRHLDKTMDREIRTAVDRMFNETKIQQGLGQLKQFAFWHIMMIQKLTNVTSFMAAYDLEMSEHGDHAQAVRVSEAVVRTTQSGAGVKDLAKVQTGTQSQQLFIAFYTYFSVMFNRERSMVRNAKKGAFGAALMSAWYLIFLPTIVESVMRGKVPDEDDDEGWVEFYAKNSAMYALTSIPVVGSLASAAFSDFPFRASPAIDMLNKSFSSTLNATTKIIEGEDLTDSMVTGILNTVGVTFGIPVSPIKRGMLAIEEWDEAPVRAFIFGQKSDD